MQQQATLVAAMEVTVLDLHQHASVSQTALDSLSAVTIFTVYAVRIIL